MAIQGLASTRIFGNTWQWYSAVVWRWLAILQVIARCCSAVTASIYIFDLISPICVRLPALLDLIVAMLRGRCFQVATSRCCSDDLKRKGGRVLTIAMSLKMAKINT